MKYKNIQKKLRIDILEKAFLAGTAHPHIGSCFSCIDILAAIHLFEMKKKDIFILSKGHASLALYAILHHQKKISRLQLDSYLKENTDFGLHPSGRLKKHIPLATGSLGHGLSFAAGVALGYQLNNNKNIRRVFCLVSDGECNEGAIWEAALFASRHNLSNLIVLIDKNQVQAFGRITEVLGDAATKAKWKAFDFSVYECNGHDMDALDSIFKKIKRKINKKPSLIICNTKRALGIESLEDKLESNYASIDSVLFEQAKKSIQQL